MTPAAIVSASKGRGDASGVVVGVDSAELTGIVALAGAEVVHREVSRAALALVESGRVRRRLAGNTKAAVFRFDRTAAHR